MNHRSGTHGKAAGKSARKGRVHPLPAPHSIARPIECSSFSSMLKHLARKSLRRLFSP
ncbi:hypothetical protein [Noviherbaspirillum sp. ST9]|uniref:hypothetical protein n=1 Tax=Noviherbaspirillum sp. ST9 TaxID=3401606 RepID=UPI003B589A97